MPKIKRIYLDHAATTPVDPVVFAKIRPYFSEKFGNPMSVHSFGQEAMAAVDQARVQVAYFLRCQPKEIVFTSGATESNNLAIRGTLKAYQAKKENQGVIPHIITTQFEHHCVLNTCQELEKEGQIEVTYLSVYADGLVRLADVKRALKSNTILVSVMYVNNEIGTVQPIVEIGQLLREAHSVERIARNSKRSTFRDTRSKILFHTDATQAVNYFDCDVNKLDVDLLSLSGHKIYGPKGVGALFIRDKSAITHVQSGGDQEAGMRAGTHNVPGIVGMAEAIRQIKSSKSKVKNNEILKLRNYLIKKVLKEIPKSHLNGSLDQRSPNNANFRFDDVEGEGLILSLDMEGVAASTGSACSSGSLDPSHVLLALGLKHEQAHGSLRLTLGKSTTKQEIEYAVKILKKIVSRLRKISGDVLKEFK
ncbi:cysteine desulfurase [Patescibacteria group bacterium]|nr:MAG: cysteine desulfurase [Patescibacteria group bacterium]